MLSSISRRLVHFTGKATEITEQMYSPEAVTVTVAVTVTLAQAAVRGKVLPINYILDPLISLPLLTVVLLATQHHRNEMLTRALSANIHQPTPDSRRPFCWSYSCSFCLFLHCTVQRSLVTKHNARGSIFQGLGEEKGLVHSSS